MRNNFAKNLIKLRAEKSISQEQLAEKLGVSRQTITSWENGKIQPSAGNLAEVAKLFDMTIDRLVFSDYKKTIVADFAEKGMKKMIDKSNEKHNNKYRKIKRILALGWPLIVLIYVGLGLITTNGTGDNSAFWWKIGWILFPLYAIISIIIGIIFDN